MDFSPCVCSAGYVHCGDILPSYIATSFEQKKNASNEIEILQLVLPYSEQLIPANLLGENRVKNEIKLYCESLSAKPLRIDSDAFKASRDYLKDSLWIQVCDLAGLDFNFLKGFHQLEYLALLTVANVHLINWPSLPPLPGLKTLNIESGTGLNGWTQFPALGQGFLELLLSNNAIDDASIDRILQWLSNEPSANTLYEIDLRHNALTKIPRQISSLKNLRIFLIAFNPLSTIVRSQSFNLSSAPISYLSLRATGIDTIESGAFQGWSNDKWKSSM